jgi:cyanate permease
LTGTEELAAEHERTTSSYRWVMLAAAALTSLLVYAMPAMSLPVLFPEIAADLDLTIVQVGVIWAVSSFTGLFVVLAGGLLGDRYGTRKILIAACLLSGLLGALRGFTGGFFTFVAASFLFGLVQPVIPINLHKTAGEWFPRRQLGLATGVVSSGFALGLMLGSLLSASVFSPALGGWQGVLILYGVVAVAMAGLWLVVYPRQDTSTVRGKGERVSFADSVRHVARIRSIWIVGLGAMGFWACTRGFVGYLPTYLRDIGWPANQADMALSLFYAVSLVAAVPFAVYTDRRRWRRQYLLLATLMMGGGAAMMVVAEGALVWVAVVMAGVVFDGFMAIFMATVLEIRGVGLLFAGTALGFAGMVREVGGVFSPPVGNSLTAFGPAVPFAFWSALAFLGAIAFLIYLKRDRSALRRSTIRP